MTVAFIQSANHMEDNINQLNTWLIDQAIHVPDGWTEACVQWLIEEHGGLSGCAQLTKADWCQLIYEQWIHADLHNLACPVLPASSEHASGTVGQSVGSTALKLEGELCLQVVGLFNVGDSYYGQLRRHEGHLSVNLPSLDNLDADLGGDPDLTQMTAQAFSQHSMFGGGSFIDPHYNSGNNATQKSLAVFLTDGVTQIKAIELGSLARDRRACGSRVLSSDELAERLRPGVKVRLRGPLTLRNKVLLLPAGVIETLAHPQFQVLGGEVDELLESHPRQLMYQLGLLLARKLNVSLPDDGSLPTWFPRVTQPRPLDSATLSEPERPLPANVAGSSFANHSESVWDTNSPPPSSDPTAIESWSNDDDVLISEAAENFEHQLLRSTDTTTPMIHALTESGDFPAPAIRMESVARPVSEDDSNDTDLSLEVDPDVLATAFGELEKDNLVNKLNRDTDPVHVIPFQTPAVSSLQSVGSSVSQTVHPTCSTSSQISSVELPHPPCSQTSTTIAQPTALEASDDLLPPAPKRKPWERKKLLTNPSKPSSVTSEAQIDSLPPTDSSQLNPALTDAYKFRPFCYIETKRVYSRNPHHGISARRDLLSLESFD
ncbi:hypothetical protein EG68_06694 [Paragonimus skrjabini miyazakii]|uniref:RecQ-mediated genome instability protein 1 n=1 Tax=Paragonimus skrjabini miyazakii TaxID=59628 RepID=A0A8S9YHY2_9TREM|nr:hypothetical protein EG68_06694 [Paragonimus skrjabini miyazakii]